MASAQKPQLKDVSFLHRASSPKAQRIFRIQFAWSAGSCVGLAGDEALSLQPTPFGVLGARLVVGWQEVVVQRLCESKEASLSNSRRQLLLTEAGRDEQQSNGDFVTAGRRTKGCGR